MTNKFDWRNSQARLIIISELEENKLALEEEETSAYDAWHETYKHMDEFKGVDFKQFRDRLKDHRQQVKRRYLDSLTEDMQLAHDRRLWPRQTHNHRGELVFDLSPAKELLREDMKASKHNTMTSSELRLSRPEYQCFKESKFRERITQEERRQKFMNHLDDHRALKLQGGKGGKSGKGEKSKKPGGKSKKPVSKKPVSNKADSKKMVLDVSDNMVLDNMVSDPMEES
jgi:hypothetical protein